MKCHFCSKDAVYRCNVCGKTLCSKHTKLTATCPTCTHKRKEKYHLNRLATATEGDKIRQLVERFWGEEEQLTFDRKFNVAQLPTYTAKLGTGIVGFISLAEMNDAAIIVALGVLPEHQGVGIGKSLIRRVESEAKKAGKRELLVSTSNDDLPALGFYQSLGFQLYEVKPNIIAEKHGEVLKGIGGLPIRDELRLRKTLR